MENGMNVKKNSVEPLYKQIADQLNEQITLGRLHPGDQLPTEKELCEQYNVSRVTIRKALEELDREKIVTRTAGKGTYVSEKKIPKDLKRTTLFSEMCRSIGLVPGARLVKIGIATATKEEATKLNIPQDSRVLHVERIRTADGKPVSVEHSVFDDYFLFLLNEDVNNCSMYDCIKKKVGIEFMYSEKTIEIVRADFEKAQYLGVSEGEPLLLIQSVVYDSKGEHRHISQQFLLGNKFQFII